MAELKNQGYTIITAEYIDRNGKRTTGKSGRIIYDTESNVRESAYYKFSEIHRYIQRELTGLEHFSKTYPKMYENFEKQQQDNIKHGLNIENIDFINPFGIYQARIAMHYQNLGKEGMKNFKPDEIDKQLQSYSIFKEFLPKSLDFVNEVSLNYIVSLFEIYISRIIEAVIQSSIHSNSLSTQKITSDFIRRNTRDLSSIKKMMKNVFDFTIVDDKWDNLLELFERRNCLTHNDGYPTVKYMNKHQVDKNQKLTPNLDYIYNAIHTIEGYLIRIHSYFYSKYIQPYIYDKFLD